MHCVVIVTFFFKLHQYCSFVLFFFLQCKYMNPRKFLLCWQLRPRQRLQSLPNTILQGGDAVQRKERILFDLCQGLALVTKFCSVLV